MHHAWNEAIQTPVRSIDRALASEEQDVVEEAAECATAEWSDHGNPEVIVAGSPHLWTVSDHVRHQARTKVTGKINGVSCLPAEAGSDAENNEEESQGSQLEDCQCSPHTVRAAGDLPSWLRCCGRP